MSAEIRTAGSRLWPVALRWSLAALVMAGVHGAAGWVLVTWERAEAAAGAPPAAMMIELAPIAVAPEAPPQEVAPGPQTVEAEPEPQPEPVQEPKPIEEPPPPEPEPVVAPEPEIKIPELPPLPDAAAMLAPPPPPKPEVKREPPPKPRVVERRKPPVNRDKPRAERTTAPAAQDRAAPVEAAPMSGASAPASAAMQASWRGTLMAHLNRYKRFPSGASPGTVQVSFRIDRAGRVMAANLVRGSGDAALDEEALAMIRRASPVPAPPDGVGGTTIALAVPVRFSR